MANPLKIWFMAIRPKTLPAAAAPVIMATAMAFGDGVHDFPTAFLCFLTALLLQIGTNLVNDYCDFKKGADAAGRIGPTRVMQAGLVKPSTMLAAIVITFLLVMAISWLLIERGGKPIAIIAAASILSAILYTAGPLPLGYIGLGELFVLIFFGPVAVAGTYYLQSYEMNPAVVLAGLGPGFLAAAVLVVNNLRDIESDERVGKRTLAVRFGAGFAKSLYLFCLITAAIVPVFVYTYMEDHVGLLIVPLFLYLTIAVVSTVHTKTDGPSLNSALAYTAQLLLIYSLLFGIGWML